MVIRYLIATVLCTAVAAEYGKGDKPACLIGSMINVQNWVDEHGNLSIVDLQFTLDLSGRSNAVQLLTPKLTRLSLPSRVKYLSLAKCNLNRVPSVFRSRDPSGRSLASTIEYLTFYGNHFLKMHSGGIHYGVAMNATGALERDFDFAFGKSGVAAWAAGFQRVNFRSLKQLDLRRCSIQVLNDNIFHGMPQLEALYLADNIITSISPNSFKGLDNLLHLDLSHNNHQIDEESVVLQGMVFKPLENLVSLDLSYTKINAGDLNSIYNFGERLERLSLCFTGLNRLKSFAFKGTRLRLLDLSGNPGILQGKGVLRGLESYLEVLYADEIGLRVSDPFKNFNRLEILRLQDNELMGFPTNIASSLTSLQVLDLTNNRLPIWFLPHFKLMPSLRFLSLQENSLNLISKEMLEDIANVTYVSFSRNFVVCNCYSREFIEIAYRNEKTTKPQLLKPRQISAYDLENNLTFHRGFRDYNEKIMSRNVVKINEGESMEDIETHGQFLLTDFESTVYQCLLVSESKSVSFSSDKTCGSMNRESVVDDIIVDEWNRMLMLLIIPTVILPALFFGFTFRKNFRYFLITMRNSATLSLINKGSVPDDNTIFNYDVFVSYCNEDRDWVLDYLLPHVEKGCNVSVCLHERDFQVGLSILENIVSCMDRSRSIMLILSQKFLDSQWCQFEMHLAQHRLLETRREDLILVLLEEIPRRLRPTTLQYLMLTKTYIVWPKVEAEQPVFWRRLKRSLVTHRILAAQNVSMA